MEKTSANRTDLSKYDNSFYQPGGILKRLLWYLVGHAFVNTYLPVPGGLKILILRLFGAKLGTGVTLKPKVNIKYPWFLEIGDHVWIGENVWIDNLTTIKIGSHSCLSQGAMLLTGNHNYTKKGFDLVVKPISIEEGVWIGAQAIVCPGVVCGSHSVLSVSSVATQNLRLYGIYQGNPATWVRERIIEE